MIGDEQSALGLAASTDIEIFKGRKMRACLSLALLWHLET